MAVNRIKMRAMKPMLVGFTNVEKNGEFTTFEMNARLLAEQGYAERLDDPKASRKAEVDRDDRADRKPPPAPAARKAPAPK